MTNDVPSIVYKFLSAAGAEIFLSKPQLRFRDWRKLDDLMEVLPGARPLTDAELDALAIEESIKRHIPFPICRARLASMGTDPEWERGLRALFEAQPCNLFISSFSARWNSGAMWALYAAEHSGIVLGIAYGNLPSRAKALGKVAYLPDRPLMPLTHVDKDVLAKAVCTKSTDWEYQEEWRAASGSGDVEVLSPGAVSEIIIGYKASDRLVEIAKSFRSSSPNTRIFSAYPHPQRHEMAREAISVCSSSQ